MNASSNALVGELRKHPCGALGAGKQQRLAAGGSRGAHVARLASAGVEDGAWRVHSLHLFEPTSALRFLFRKELGSTAEGGEKQRTPA